LIEIRCLLTIEVLLQKGRGARTKVDIKARAKAKVRTKNVD